MLMCFEIGKGKINKFKTEMEMNPTLLKPTPLSGVKTHPAIRDGFGESQKNPA